MDYQHDAQQEPSVRVAPGDTSEPDEPCDGLDNDGDGRTDERHPDVDGDGVADCVDQSCAVDLSETEEITERSACQVTLSPPADPWSVELLWETPPEDDGCTVGSVVVDIDGDGISDLLCPSYHELVVYAGDDGRVLWTYGELQRFSPLAVADVGGDGAWEIFAISQQGEILCLSPGGEVQWRSVIVADMLSERCPHAIEIADLLADGRPEVVVDQAILSAADGALLAPLENTVREADFSLMVADADRDEEQEVVVRGRAFSALGLLEWSVAESELTQNLYFVPLAVQADKDDEAEIAFVAVDSFRVVEADGSPLVAAALPVEDNLGALACAGDIDGDGWMEVLIADETKLRALDLDGNEEWTAEIDDTNTDGAVGCTVFDFDLDGAKEVLLADQDHFFIFDGRSGAVLFRDTHLSATVGDVPLVADLDGDGSVEIVVLNFGGYENSTTRVYSNTNRDWPPGAPIWPSATWSGTSLFLDGSVPRTPEAPWLTTQVWRGQPESFIRGMDLRPEITDWCVSCCEEAQGQVLLALRLVNLGPQEAQRGVSVAAYGLDEKGQRTLLGTAEFSEFIDNGTASAAQQVALSVEQARNGVVFVAGDQGEGTLAIEDCDPSNNELEWRLADCD